MTAQDSLVSDFCDARFQREVLENPLPVLVDFWAPWCRPCMAMGPIIEKFAQAYEGRVLVGKLNVDENARIPAEYGVRSIPYLVLFKEGKVLDAMAGLVSQSQLESFVEKHLA